VASVPSSASIQPHSFHPPERSNAPGQQGSHNPSPFSALLDAGSAEAASPEASAAAGSTAAKKPSDATPPSADKPAQPSNGKDQPAGTATDVKAAKDANGKGGDPKQSGQATADTSAGSRRPGRAKGDATAAATAAANTPIVPVVAPAATPVATAAGAQAAIVANTPITDAGSPTAKASKGGDGASAISTISAPSAPTTPTQPSAVTDATLVAAASVNPKSSPSPQSAPAAAPAVAPANPEATVVTPDAKNPSSSAPGAVTTAPPQLSPQQPAPSPGGEPSVAKPPPATVETPAQQPGGTVRANAAAVSVVSSVAATAVQAPLAAKEVARASNGPGGASSQKAADNGTSAAINAADATAADHTGAADAPTRDAPPPANSAQADAAPAFNPAGAQSIAVEPRQAASARSKDAELSAPSTTNAPLTIDGSAAATTAVSPASSASASASQSVAPAPTASTGTAVPLVGLGVEIAARALAGKNRFDISLDPPELGRISVRLEVSRDGAVTSHVVADRADTLNLLRRDAPDLQRALQDAGLKTSDNALQFSLRDQGFAGREQQHRDGAATARLVIPDAAVPRAEAPAISYGRSLGALSGIDIRV
jgi:flagellar hook-length control protein FliK